ncbi:MAG: hypothetical protein HYZ74_03410, partial [Elusimicrobia bacterium]|nr:hypothetical protein [Elusimicrobiota bacterium]
VLVGVVMEHVEEAGVHSGDSACCLPPHSLAAELGPTEAALPLDVANFLLDRPDLTAFILKRRKIAPYRIERQGARRSLADDGEDTRGTVDLVESSNRRRVYYLDGVHRARYLPEIRATAVIVLELREAGKGRTAATLRVWVRLKNRVLSGVVKAVRPFLRETINRKFRRVFSAAERLGLLMSRDPASFSEDARAFPGLSDGERGAFQRLMGRFSI